MEKQINNYNLGYSIRQLRERWKFIFFTLCIFIILGICYFYYMKQTPVYTAKCVLLYQIDNLHKPQGNIFQEKNTIEFKEQINELPITLFPKIVYSLPFLGELIDISITNDSIQDLSIAQISHISTLKNKFVISINEKDKLITIEATMPSPKEAAELAQKIQQTIYKYTLQWYSQQKKEYIQTLEDNYKYIITKSLATQQELIFIQKNNNSQNYQEALSLGIEYNSLEKLNIAIAEQLQKTQLEQQNPGKYFTIIDPVTIPNTPSNIQKSIIYYIVVFAFLGIIISVYIILIHPIIISLFSYQEINSKE